MDKLLIFIAIAIVAGILSGAIKGIFKIRVEGSFVGQLILEIISMACGAIIYALMFA